MAWIALNRRTSAACWPPEPPIGDCLITRGAMVIDLDFSHRQKAPCKLVCYSADHGWRRRFTIYLNADFSLSLEVQQGRSRCYARLAAINLREAATLRLTYSWDAPHKRGLLSVVDTADGAIHQVVIHAPPPLPIADATAIICGSENVTWDDRVRGLAISDTATAVGPAPSITAGALIGTTRGARAIERLRLGDMVLTKGGDARAVRWIVKQHLPAMGASAPIRLRAPFFGLGQDLVVASDQRILVTGSSAEYNFGQDSVLIEAKNLVRHPFAEYVQDAVSTAYFQVLLDTHECINVSGTWADSLYVGHLGKSPQVLATTQLADIPKSILPLHRAPVHRTLRNYECKALLDSLSA